MVVSSVADRLWDRIDPYLAAEGVELDDVEVLGGGQILRVTVDADGGVGVETIADLSRGISRILDDEDPISSSYTLEVSSPGLERKLTRPRHYEKSVGREVKIKTHAAVDGDRNHRGPLVDAGADSFTMEVDGNPRIIDYGAVASARTVYVWETAGRPGKDS